MQRQIWIVEARIIHLFIPRVLFLLLIDIIMAQVPIIQVFFREGLLPFSFDVLEDIFAPPLHRDFFFKIKDFFLFFLDNRHVLFLQATLLQPFLLPLLNHLSEL
mmetsp:Transcript_13781/g.13467  ORF Transcript_13781/g.13467 Transcript_13781/m.13467 type:complete len:104 (+) Transcript_13781:169-480(+)